MRKLTLRRFLLQLAACAAVLAALIVIAPGVGTEARSFGWWDVWRAKLGAAILPESLQGRPAADLDGDGRITPQERDTFVQTAKLIFDQRLPRTLLALIVGATLALCGATFQILFRNALATPYTLGVASGGSLGAMIAIKVGWVCALWGVSSLAVAAFGGAIGVVTVVMLIASGMRKLTSNELLLAGVTVGLFCSAMMMLVTSISSERQTFAMVRWMMGSLDAVAVVQGARLLPLVLPAWLVLLLLAPAFNQYRLGDDLATTRGVHVARLQLAAVLVCTLAVAGVVAECGPIGFVGLVVPHVVVLLVGSDCRILLPASALVGGVFLIVCDWASQLAMNWAGTLMGRQLGSATLPIGVITAIVGVPLFLLLLRTRRR